MLFTAQPEKQIIQAKFYIAKLWSNYFAEE